jgi:hypothetical protein
MMQWFVFDGWAGGLRLDNCDTSSTYCQDDDFWVGLGSINTRGVYLVYPPLSPRTLR